MLLSIASGLTALWMPPPAALQTDVTPAPWERRAGDGFENLGVARIERLNDRLMLTVLCGLPHSTYLDNPSPEFAEQIGRYLRAQYHYVDRQVDVRCFQAPCPSATERRIVLDRVDRLSLSDEQANTISRDCGAAIGK